jgi:hypothetical protein
MLKFPELGNHVRSLVASSRPYDMVLDMSIFTSEDLAICEAVMNWVGANLFDVPRESCPLDAEVEIWMQDFRKGNWDAILSLLLTLLPNLTEIEMQRYSNYDYLYITKALLAARHNHSRRNTWDFPLKHLSSVSLAYSNTEGGLSIELAIPYLEIPTLRKAEVYMMSMSSSTEVLEQYSEGNLTDLRLDQCVISGNALIRFLRLFPKLTSFHYDQGGWMIGESAFLPQKIGQAIAHLQPCLEKLYLRDIFGEDGQDEGNEDEYEDENGEPGSLGSLAGFERLHTVILQYSTLFGTSDDDDVQDGIDSDGRDKESVDENRDPSPARLVDLLPKSLRQLVLTEVSPSPDNLDQMRQIIQNREEFPCLEAVNIGHWSWKLGAEISELKEESPGFADCDEERL